MYERQMIPDRLAERLPGPELAALLASLDRSRINGHDMVIVARARARLAAWVQAELLADLAEIAHCPPGGPDVPPARTTTVQEYAADEIGFALRWTRRAAEAQLGLALDVVERHPALYHAMRDGALDLPKARVVADALAVLDGPAADRVVERVLPVAAGLTTGALRARLARLVIAVDPAAAQRRLDRAVSERRLVCEPDTDGSARITALGLPPDRAVAATERVDALARAAKLAGDTRTLDQLRADVLLGLLDGTHAGPGPVQRRGVVELTVPLATLAELSESPGELAGFGPVTADVARRVAEAQRRATWRYSALDSTGVTVGSGITRRRPTRAVADQVVARDRTCRAPNCRAPASRIDLDHTIDHTHGGPTTGRNLGALCRHHHRAKHRGGYRLRQPQPGVFHWTTPLGHHYRKTPDAADDSATADTAIDA
ncbi:MAG: DUF222 domain-containing protein [Micromonosporaceae bacterium]